MTHNTHTHAHTHTRTRTHTHTHTHARTCVLLVRSAFPMLKHTKSTYGYTNTNTDAGRTKACHKPKGGGGGQSLSDRVKLSFEWLWKLMGGSNGRVTMGTLNGQLQTKTTSSMSRCRITWLYRCWWLNPWLIEFHIACLSHSLQHANLTTSKSNT